MGFIKDKVVQEIANRVGDYLGKRAESGYPFVLWTKPSGWDTEGTLIDKLERAKEKVFGSVSDALASINPFGGK